LNAGKHPEIDIANESSRGGGPENIEKKGLWGRPTEIGPPQTKVKRFADIEFLPNKGKQGDVVGREKPICIFFITKGENEGGLKVSN